jgi:hypothetical protein
MGNVTGLFSCIRPSPLQEILAEKLIVIGLSINYPPSYGRLPFLTACNDPLLGPILKRYSAIYYIKSYRLRFTLIFFPTLKHVTPKLSLFFKFYDSSFVLTDLLLAAFYSVTFYDVTVNFTMPQFVLNAISRGYKVSRPNTHRTRPNKLRRTSIKIMFSAEGVRVFPLLSLPPT